jgi:hypothetical protein
VWKICHQSPKILREKISEFATFRQWFVSCSTAFSKFRFLNIFFSFFFNIKAGATCNTAGWISVLFMLYEFYCGYHPKKKLNNFFGAKRKS